MSENVDSTWILPIQLFSTDISATTLNDSLRVVEMTFTVVVSGSFKGTSRGWMVSGKEGS